MKLNEAMIKRIEDLSIEHRLPVPQWAMKAGIIPSTLYNMMKKKSCPRITTVKLLCDAIGITLEEFFSVDDIDTAEYEEP